MQNYVTLGDLIAFATFVVCLTKAVIYIITVFYDIKKK